MKIYYLIYANDKLDRIEVDSQKAVENFIKLSTRESFPSHLPPKHIFMRIHLQEE